MASSGIFTGRSGDRVFFTLVLILALAGIAIFASAALGLLARDNVSVTRDILDQVGLGLVLGLIALFICRSLPLIYLRTYAPWIYGFTVVLTALVFIPGIGVSSLGATRWINVGF